jgi:hydrogenase expression/formation protein HypE
MQYEKILLDHGSGGRASRWLVEQVIVPRLHNPILDRLNDHATIEPGGGRLAFTTDSYVVDPIFFPGGDIGRLAINGTVNDLAMGGATPLFLSAGFIIEEGFPIAELIKIVDSMAQAAQEAHVKVVTGDTKVVPRGKADKIFINTSGVGRIIGEAQIDAASASVGDIVILSGPIGEHGVAILSGRPGLDLSSPCVSDTAPLAAMVEDMLAVCPEIHCLRDPTRGGIAATLDELSRQSNVRMELDESSIEVSEAVSGACEILGLDPMHLANEGLLVCIAPERYQEALLKAMRGDSRGTRARVIGKVVEGKQSVILRTIVGARRILTVPTGAIVPRIC